MLKTIPKQKSNEYPTTKPGSKRVSLTEKLMGWKKFKREEQLNFVYGFLVFFAQYIAQPQPMS